MTKAEVAAWLRVSSRTVDYYVERRLLPRIELGPRLVRFRIEDVEALVEHLATVPREQFFSRDHETAKA
jgi:excisionase family DNA binding protein